jgi:hypothetical protein
LPERVAGKGCYLPDPFSSFSQIRPASRQISRQLYHTPGENSIYLPGILKFMQGNFIFMAVLFFFMPVF